ncbi:MAG TPA: tetratricopeptide repeat protein, partial [Gemmatimonadaceae bacterium]|nr:tetratricopeptide repeat protein [Gemmatimonadaceae bacterium]
MSNVAKLKKKAAELEQKKQFDKALAVYVDLLGQLSGHEEDADVALYNRVGDLMVRHGDVGQAVEYYEKAVDLYAEGGFFNNAIALCNKILRTSPGRASIYYKLGRISAKKGFSSDAKQNYLEYADRMQKAGKLDEAFRALKEFADLCPDQDDIRLMLAEQLAKKQRNGEALEQLQVLYEKFAHVGRAAEARATIDRMKAIDPAVEPKSGTGGPKQKAGDLVFLDVSFDEKPRPGAPRKSVGGRSIPEKPAAPAK